MEVSSAQQYLCSLEGNLLEELEDTQQVFVASLVLSDVLAGGRGSNKYTLFTLKKLKNPPQTSEYLNYKKENSPFWIPISMDLH